MELPPHTNTSHSEIHLFPICSQASPAMQTLPSIRETLPEFFPPLRREVIDLTEERLKPEGEHEEQEKEDESIDGMIHKVYRDKIGSSAIPSQFKSHVCGSCHETYRFVTALRNHIKSVHPNLRYPCQYCGKGFLSWEYCKVHERRACKANTVAGSSYNGGEAYPSENERE